MTKQEIINAVYPIVRDTQTSAEIADAILGIVSEMDEEIICTKDTQSISETCYCTDCKENRLPIYPHY